MKKPLYEYHSTEHLCLGCSKFCTPDFPFISDSCERCIGTKFVPIDTRAIEWIKLFNRKGYCTRFCCSGHSTDNLMDTYVVFDANSSRKIIRQWKNLPGIIRSTLQVEYFHSVLKFENDDDDIATQISYMYSHDWEIDPSSYIAIRAMDKYWEDESYHPNNIASLVSKYRSRNDKVAQTNMIFTMFAETLDGITT